MRLVLPLLIIFRSILETSLYPEQWKLANVVPIHKKEDKQLVENYRPISLLPIYGKIFEKLVFDSLYSYYISNKGKLVWTSDYSTRNTVEHSALKVQMTTTKYARYKRPNA